WSQFAIPKLYFSDPKTTAAVAPPQDNPVGDYGTAWLRADALRPVSSLGVTLSATPTGGLAPLTTNLQAAVSGAATGTINYTFWWNCADAGKSVDAEMAVCGPIPTPTTTGSCRTNENGFKCNGVSDNPRTAPHTYSAVGSYTAKVIVERGNAPPAEARTVVTATPSGCTWSLSRSGDTLGGGTAGPAFSVTTQSGCSWTAKTTDDWITLRPVSGCNTATASGSVCYAVTANTTRSTRIGHITLADQTFTVMQAACTWILPRTEDNLDGGTVTPLFSVTTPIGCAWTANTTDDWISLRSVSGCNSGTASGSVCYAVSGNTTGVARVGRITIADQSFTVRQAACTWTFPRTGDNLDGGTATPFF